ncbi:MAG TPA: glycosyltransferase family 4 protein [Candidatus Aquilonibacter sp.]
MKLLLVTSRFPFGPKESFLTEEVLELAKLFDITLFPAVPTAEATAVPELQTRSVRMRLFSPAVLRHALAETLRSPLHVMRTFATIVGAPRAVHAKIKNALVFPTALAAARVARDERIDHVHAYWMSAPSTVAYVVARLCGIPWSATGHRYDLVDFNVCTVGTPSSGFFATARFVRTISRQGAERLAYFSLNGPPVHVIHLGVALPAHIEPTRASTMHLICAANLEPVKGHETLLLALAGALRLVPARVTIAGDGSLRASLEALTTELGINEYVTFEGSVPHDRLLARLRAGEFHAAILTSVDEGPAQREGIPVFLMEAMAAGLPVIATRSGAIVELGGGDAALLCDPGDSAGVCGAIVALAKDARLRARFGAAGRARVERDFDVRSCAMTLSEQICDKPAPAMVTARGVEISV